MDFCVAVIHAKSSFAAAGIQRAKLLFYAVVMAIFYALELVYHGLRELSELLKRKLKFEERMVIKTLLQEKCSRCQCKLVCIEFGSKKGHIHIKVQAHCDNLYTSSDDSRIRAFPIPASDD